VTTQVTEASFRSLFRSRDFAVLYVAGTQSQLGDQLARVALSVLVYAKTGSGLITASTYALTFLPAIVGGVLFASLADTRPRRTLLVSCDLLRAALFALMAIPALPVASVAALLVIAVLVSAPYNAAEPAIVADMFSGAPYQTAVGLRTATSQAMQLVGFGVGGLLVSLVGADLALLINAATFVCAALLIKLGLPSFAAPARGTRPIRQFADGARAIAADPRLRVLLGLAWLTGLWVVPEGLAAPYAHAHGASASAVGILLAANPLGNLIGTVVLTRWVKRAVRTRWVGALAVGAGLPLAACAGAPPIWLAVLLWTASGACTAYLVMLIADFVAVVRPGVRGQAIGLASASLLAAQGIGLVLGGLASTVWGTATAIAVAGTVGSLAAVPLALAYLRTAQRAVQI
jgi:predicted MFS family arabinose efflux permease